MSRKHALKFPHLVEKAGQLYLELHSTRKVADELGIDKHTCWSYIKRAGVDTSARNAHLIASTKRKKVVDGIVFYWSEHGYYRGTTAPGKREPLTSYMYRKMYGTEKPKWLTVMFKDGDRENYAPENLEFVSASECAKVRTAERLEDCLKCLEKGRETRKKLYEEKPYLKQVHAKRSWITRRRNDPEGAWVEKCQATKKANAEERGYWFSPEAIENLRKSHIGNTKEVVMMKKMKREQEAVMAKLGMKFKRTA